MPRGWRKLGTYPTKKAANEVARYLKKDLQVNSRVAQKVGSKNTKVDIIIKKDTVRILGKRMDGWAVFFKVRRKKRR